jgi:hypothetical protein
MRRQVKCWHVPPICISLRWFPGAMPCHEGCGHDNGQPTETYKSLGTTQLMDIISSLQTQANPLTRCYRYTTSAAPPYQRICLLYTVLNEDEMVRWCWFLAEILKWWRTVVVLVNRWLAGAVQCGTWEAATSGQGRFSGTRRGGDVISLSTETRCRCLIRKGMTFPCLLSAVGKVWH